MQNLLLAHLLLTAALLGLLTTVVLLQAGMRAARRAVQTLQRDDQVLAGLAGQPRRA